MMNPGRMRTLKLFISGEEIPFSAQESAVFKERFTNLKNLLVKSNKKKIKILTFHLNPFSGLAVEI